MKLLTFISAGVFILASAFVMKKNNPVQPVALYDTKWSLKKIHSESGTEEVFTKAFIKFNQEKKSAGGNGSCNSFGSTALVDGSKITFSHLFSTKMYCEGVQQTEDKFFKLLEQVTRFQVKEKLLILYQDDIPLLEFVTS